MNKAKYMKRYGVAKNDPCSHDGLPAPIKNSGRYGHVPLSGEPAPRLVDLALAVIGKIRGR